jgi:hypothetical protein
MDASMDHGKSASRHRRARSWHVAAASALVAGTILAACGGGSHSSGPGTAAAQQTAKTMAVFAQCMRGHGEPDFYYANPHSISASSGTAFSLGQGYLVTGLKPQAPAFQSALAACKHLLPPQPRSTLTQQQLQRDIKSAQCMRAHGYPGYPDPDVQHGQLVQKPLPSSIDTSSPQFEAAQKACGEG